MLDHIVVGFLDSGAAEAEILPVILLVELCDACFVLFDYSGVEDVLGLEHVFLVKKHCLLFY